MIQPTPVFCPLAPFPLVAAGAPAVIRSPIPNQRRNTHFPAAGIDRVFSRPAAAEHLSVQARVDNPAILVDDLLIRHLLEYQGEEAARHLEVGSIPLVRRTLHFAVRQDLHESASIIASFNDAIRTMLADGTYNDILQLSWIRADVDGDGKLELVPRDADQIGKVAPASGYNVVWPGSAQNPAAAPRRYFVEGQVYESWAAVPDYYKVPSDAAIDGYQGSTSGLFSFKF